MGSPPVPLSQFVLKVHSRCDLACDHCYVYEHADQSWRRRPGVMSDEMVAQAALRIAEHARRTRSPACRSSCTAGSRCSPARAAAADHHRRSGRPWRVCGLDLRIHTNGVLLDEGFCELFAEHGVKVGVSLDGDRAANDRHRRYRDGRSSYDQVIRAIESAARGRFRELYAGMLCTIDVANDPIAVYEALVALDPPRIDFLLPTRRGTTHPARPTPRRASTPTG